MRISTNVFDITSEIWVANLDIRGWLILELHLVMEASKLVFVNNKALRLQVKPTMSFNLDLKLGILLHYDCRSIHAHNTA